MLRFGVERFSILIALFGAAVYAQDQPLPTANKTYPYSIPSRPPTPPPIRSALSQQQAAEAKALRDLGATLKYKVDRPNGKRVDIRGNKLATIDPGIFLSPDKEKHIEEVKRLLATLRPAIGDYSEMQFVVSLSGTDLENLDTAAFYIHIEQMIGEYHGAKSTIYVNENNDVIVMQLKYYDTKQQNVLPQYRLSEDEAIRIAKNALMSEQTDKQRGEIVFGKEVRAFIEVNDDLKVEPVAHFSYRRRAISINLITGGIESFSTSRRCRAAN